MDNRRQAFGHGFHLENLILKKYVHIGVGISIVTEICITESDREQFAIVKLDEFFPARKYGIITRETRALSAPAQKLIEILNDEYHGQPSKVGI